MMIIIVVQTFRKPKGIKKSVKDLIDVHQMKQINIIVNQNLNVDSVSVTNFLLSPFSN